ncbi:MAG TPA: pitrilysin family protein [Candidatus Woesebacteria bacterium]|nr:pitrilysin family protein [Candidatus Woesebacteria bacterium]
MAVGVFGSNPKHSFRWAGGTKIKNKTKFYSNSSRSSHPNAIINLPMLKLSDLNLSLETAKLKNGIKIVNFRRSGAPLAIRCLFFAGSRFDNIEGTSHFLEHLLVAGTKKYPSKNKLASYIENNGGVLGAVTSMDNLAINLSLGDPKDISIASEILKEVIFNPIFKDKTIENERQAIYRELSDRKSNPSKAIGTVNRQLFYQDTILGRSTLGTESSIKNIKKEDIVTYYQNNILTSQMVLVTSGDISIDVIKKEFTFLESLNFSVRTPKNDLAVNQQKRILIEKFNQNDQITFSYAFRTGNISDTTNPTLSIILQALAATRSSRLITRLRYENGLIYGINSWHEQLFDAGTWGFQTSTSKSNFQKVIDIIEKEFYTIIQDGLPESDLNFVKNKIIKSSRLNLQTSESIVGFHAYKQFINSDKPWTIQDYTESLEKVDCGLIKAAAIRYLNPTKSYLAVCGDISEKEINLAK